MHPGIEFFGSSTAELFSNEVNMSYREVLKRNFIFDKNDEMYGFTSASIEGRAWSDTMWTRDAGVFLRELVEWGNIEAATALSNNLMKMVAMNQDGYYVFPQHFMKGEPKSGTELDGTSAIIIGMIMLYTKADKAPDISKRLLDFLAGPGSPIFYILKQLEKKPLLSGSGEFGGGCFLDGEYYNVVQNSLSRLAIIAAKSLPFPDEIQELLLSAEEKLTLNIKKYFVSTDYTLKWAIKMDTLQPTECLLNHIINKGAGMINGVLSTSCDVVGFDVNDDNFPFLKECKNTFYNLYNSPLRSELFEKYGIWTQFDEYATGSTSPSYGQAYAIQCMILLNNIDMLTKAIGFLAQHTYQPIKEYTVTRSSPYFFYERMYSPYSVDRINLDEGCGALNLVNVAEPMKIARLMTGIDDSGGILKIMPRLPHDFTGYNVTNWLVRNNKGGLMLCDIEYNRIIQAISVNVKQYNA